MKLFLCTWTTNYGLSCCIVCALTKDSAILLAFKAGAWTSLEVNEIIPSDKEEVLKIDFYQP